MVGWWKTKDEKQLRASGLPIDWKRFFYWLDKLYNNELLLFNIKEILQKAKERYSKEKTAAYYLQHKEAIKEKSKNGYKNLSKEEKDKIKE